MQEPGQTSRLKAAFAGRFQISRPYVVSLLGYVLLLLGIAASADLGLKLWVFKFAAWIPLGDKLGHLVLAGIFSFLLNSALCCRTSSLFGLKMRMGSLIACLLVLTEEFSQLWIASRNVELTDVLFDVAGIYLFGVLATRNWRMKRDAQRRYHGQRGGRTWHNPAGSALPGGHCPRARRNG
jgi:hypothetical protein